MDIQIADLVNPDTNPLPDEVRDLVAALIEGRVSSMFLVAEISDPDGSRSWIQGFDIDMDDNESDDFAFIGRITLAVVELQQELIGGNIHMHITPGDDDEEEDE